jgi:hypothetical protein
MAAAAAERAQQSDDTGGLAAFLNALTIPGRPLRARELRSKTSSSFAALSLPNAAGGDLVVGVTESRGLVVALGGGNAAQVVEVDLQSGGAVAHVLGAAPEPQATLSNLAGGAAGAAAQAKLRYASAAEALRDPRLGVGRFAGLVRAAGLEAVLGDAAVRMTLFAPSDAVRGADVRLEARGVALR